MASASEASQTSMPSAARLVAAAGRRALAGAPCACDRVQQRAGLGHSRVLGPERRDRDLERLLGVALRDVELAQIAPSLGDAEVCQSHIGMLGILTLASNRQRVL